MTEHDNDSDALETLFAAGRSAEIPSDAFMARLLADASEEVGKNVPPVAQVTATKRRSFWQSWLPVSGLTAATLAGVWIGTALPYSDFGSEYLAALGTSDGVFEEFTPEFGFSVLLEGEE